MNIALFSPNQKAYSETFIDAHKKGLKGNVFYYYGSGKDIRLENSSRRMKSSLWHKIWARLSGRSLFKVEDWLVQSLLENKIDVALVEYGNHAHHLLPVFKRVSIPLVVHFHGYDANRKDIVSGCHHYRELFPRAAKVVAVSTSMKQGLEDLGCPKEKLVYTACGADNAFEAIHPNFANKHLLSVGRFVDKKAPYYSIMAFAKVVERYPEAKLLMVGTGPLLDVSTNLARYLGIKHKVEFLGVVNTSRIQELMKTTQVFVQHSITTSNGDQEGTPVGIMEASLAGLPVVATKHAGIPDVILDGETGFLVEEHDVEAMAERIIEILEDTALAKKMGQAGKTRASAHFTLNHHLDVLNKTLKEVLA